MIFVCYRMLIDMWEPGNIYVIQGFPIHLFTLLNEHNIFECVGISRPLDDLYVCLF